MDTLSYKTISANKATVKHNWFVIDAENQVVGRLASKIANIIRGKNKASFTPHVNCGDKVIVINADKVRFTGKKMTKKEYITFSGYPSGQKRATAKEMLERKPTSLLESAVKGMLPKNKLQKEYMKNMHLFIGTEHPHTAQQPQKIEI